MLVDYIHDLREAGVKATVPASHIASIAFINRIAAPDFPLPVGDVLVVGAVRSHRRNTKGKRRKSVIYRVEQVRALERAARTLNSALLRVIVQTELRKLYAGLRNDDAIWDSPTSWRTDGEGGRDDYMYGEASKTKATETTSARLNETMPWISPIRGVCQVQSGWHQGVLSNLELVGVDAHAEYAAPSPRNVLAGKRPPGATESDGWQTRLRRALREAGMPEEAARLITRHSAKNTLLTWAGGSGMFSDRDIEILGHHRICGVGRTVRAYNMQELSAPVRKLSKMLDAIATNVYQPDRLPGLQWPGSLPTEEETDSELGDVENINEVTDALVSDGNEESNIPGCADEFAQQSGQAGELSALAGTVLARAVAASPHGYIVGNSPIGLSGKYFYHVAILARYGPKDSKAAKRKRIVLSCPSGEVTNMCDFTFLGATWKSFPPSVSGAVLCKVCRARLKRYAATQNDNALASGT